MDFNGVLKAHMAWRGKLRKYLAGDVSQVDPRTASVDDACVAGKWIHAEGEAHFGADPVFHELKSAHAAFHGLVGKVLQAAARDRRDAETVLESADYMRTTNRMVRALSIMRKRAD